MTDQQPTLAQIAADKTHPNCTTAEHKLLAQATGLEEMMHFLLLASAPALQEALRRNWPPSSSSP